MCIFFYFHPCKILLNYAKAKNVLSKGYATETRKRDQKTVRAPARELSRVWVYGDLRPGFPTEKSTFLHLHDNLQEGVWANEFPILPKRLGHRNSFFLNIELSNPRVWRKKKLDCKTDKRLLKRFTSQRGRYYFLK